MNTPTSLEPLQPPPSVTQRTLPTVGSILGSVLGSVVVTKAGLDPVTGTTVLAGLTALVTGLFHWLGSKIGVPL